jgi:isochorismate synthase
VSAPTSRETSASAPHLTEIGLRELTPWLTEALEGEARVVVLPAPVLDARALVRAARKCETWWLEQPALGDEPSRTLLGLGVAEASVLAACGEAALEAHVASARAWPCVVHPSADPALADRMPHVLFGHAFAAGAAGEESWRDHGDGRAVTPRWTYLREAERAVLVFTASGQAWRGRAAVVAAELETLLGALPGRTQRHVGRVELDPSSPAAFHDRVEAARAAIARGALTKVVCSRRASVSAELDLEPTDVLDRLAPTAALRFLVRRGSSVLVGATPERLFRKEARRVSTEALAGTRAEGTSVSEQALLASAKDNAEHAPVVEAIVARLCQLGAAVRADASPRLKRAANVVHLRTAIEAELPEATTAVALLDALHPTPAVGGTPREAAEAFIRAHEPPRGWYSGPLGWIDARGDADVHVMLRCGVLRGARAWVFAGGGIVASSDPHAEHAETELKMAPLLRALGVSAANASPASAGSPEDTREPRDAARLETPLGAESRA